MYCTQNYLLKFIHKNYLRLSADVTLILCMLADKGFNKFVKGINKSSSNHHVLVLKRTLLLIAARPKLCSAETQTMYLKTYFFEKIGVRKFYIVSGLKSVIVNFFALPTRYLLQYWN